MAKEGFYDFDLLIEGLGEGLYRARVLDSPAGPAVEDVRLQFTQLELENFMLRVGRPHRLTRGVETPEMEPIKTFGAKMFKSIFQETILTVLGNSLEEANKRGKGLRIRLHLNNANELVNLPWEFLYNPELNRFLSLSVTTPIIRYLELPERILPLTITPPLHILVIISSPDDVPPLDTEREWNNLKSAVCDLEEKGLLVIERIDKATPMELQYKLRNNVYHILHFIGHGGFDEQAQDGVLIFEDKNNHSRPLSGQYLGTLLHDERTMRLVLLNACEGGRTGTTDPFAGVAQSLVQQGIPAVIAMQFEISDDTAITFAHEFYAAITDGYPVDGAMSEARKGIYLKGNEIEWGTPVLYMRLPDGQLFDIRKEASQMAKTVAMQKPPEYRKPLTAQPLNTIISPGMIQQHTNAVRPALPRTATRTIPSQPSALTKAKMIWIAGGVIILMFAFIFLAAFLLLLRPTRLSSYAGMVKVTTDLYHAQPGSDAKLQDFWVDRYEVTNLAYAQYLSHHRGSPPTSWIDGKFPPGRANFPVQGITWTKAESYCKAQGKRLPTQAEWELAARGPFGWQFPWGNDAGNVRQELDGTLEVGSNASNRSYFGAYYMSGNVGEWVSDLNPSGIQADHLLLGGTFGPRDALTSTSHGTDHDLAVVNAGIRCAADQNDALEKSLNDVALTLDDNFDSTNTSWPKIGEKGDKFIYNYHDPDYYHLEDRMPETFIPAFYEPLTFHNFVLETEAFVDAKNTDNQQGNFFYGLAVKQGIDQIYAIVVSAKTHEWQALQGTLPKNARYGSATDLLIIETHKQPQIIGASEGQADRLVVIANDAELIYYVNGSLVYRQIVENFSRRNIGFIAVTQSDITRIHIHFNWVSLQKIEPFDENNADLSSYSSQEKINWLDSPQNNKDFSIHRAQRNPIVLLAVSGLAGSR